MAAPNFPLRVDDKLMYAVERAAAREDLSMNRMIEKFIREGLASRRIRIMKVPEDR